MGFPPKDWLFWFQEYFFGRKYQGDPVSEVVPESILERFTRCDFPDFDSFYIKEIKIYFN